MHCVHCGSNLSDDSQFCAKCGKPVTPEGRPSIASGQPDSTTSQSLRRSAAWLAAKALIIWWVALWFGRVLPIGTQNDNFWNCVWSLVCLAFILTNLSKWKRDRVQVSSARIGWVLAIFFVVVSIHFGIKAGEEQPSTSNSEFKQSSEADAFAKMSPDQHLATAKQLLQTRTSPAYAEANHHLNAVPSTTPGYFEAQSLIKKSTAALPEIQRVEEKQRREAEIDANPLEVLKSTWEKGGFDNVAIWHVTFRNRSAKPVGNIKHRIAYYSETGEKVDSGGVDSILGAGVIQKVIPPKGTRALEINDGFLHHEAHRANFEVVGWQFVADRR